MLRAMSKFYCGLTIPLLSTAGVPLRAFEILASDTCVIKVRLGKVRVLSRNIDIIPFPKI